MSVSCCVSVESCAGCAGRLKPPSCPLKLADATHGTLFAVRSCVWPGSGCGCVQAFPSFYIRVYDKQKSLWHVKECLPSKTGETRAALAIYVCPASSRFFPFLHYFSLVSQTIGVSTLHVRRDSCARGARVASTHRSRPREVAPRCL